MSKYPVVILHGWNLYSEKYQILRSTLVKEGFRVYIPDLPGFGKRIVPKTAYNIDDYVDFVLDYLKSNKIKKCIIIGHSFGGRVAVKLAARYPYYLDRLILTGTPGFVPVNKARITVFYLIAKIGKILLFFLPPLLIFKNTLRKIIYRLAKSSDYLHVEGVMKDTFKSVIKEDLISSMLKIKTPTLLVWGKDDRIVPVSIAQKMESAIIASSLTVIPNASHKVPYQDPDKFYLSIRKFISK